MPPWLFVDMRRLSSVDIDHLLTDLCVRLGFCLSPEDQTGLRDSPPPDVDSFTDAVFRAEGMDPLLDKGLRRQVREMVRQAVE